MKNSVVVLLIIAFAILVLSFIFNSFVPLIVLFSVLLVVGIIALQIVPPMVEKSMNKVITPSPYEVSPEVKKFHQTLSVVDLHADPLLWKRDLLKRSDYGHVDVPRLIEGNVAFQVFGVVTKSPKGQNFQKNAADAPDNITLLSVLQLWPFRTWRSLFARAMYQARKLDNLARRSNGKLVFIRYKKDLENYLESRKVDSQKTAGFPMLEGCHALEGKLENLDHLYHAGFRVIGLNHFFDNEVGGSAHGLEKKGLTPFGFEVVKRVFELNMILDLAHTSPAVVDEVLKIADRPVIASHTGVCGTCDNERNLSDEHVKGIARTGGVMGIAMFDTAVGETTIKAVVSAIRYVVDLVGVDYVAVGGDMDGSVLTPVDVSGLPLLTAALLDEGFSEEEIAKIMGLNALRVIHQLLPEK